MSQNYDNLHILIISNSYPTIFNPFAGIFWNEQAKYLSKIGHKVGVIGIVPISFKLVMKKKCFFKESIKKSNSLNEYVFCYSNFPKLNFLESYIAKWKGRKYFKSYLKKYGKPDVIHLHRYEAGLFGLYIRKKFNIPIVLTEHSSRFLYNQLTSVEQKIAIKVFSNVDYRIAVSPYLKTNLEKDYNLSFDYIPNSVDTEKFKVLHSINKNETFTFLSIGNLGENKNQMLLINAFELFYREFPDSKLIIGGDGNLKSFLQSEIDKKGLTENIQLIGNLSREEVIEWNNKSHVFVVSSKKETFSVVIIEALSCGIPVISTRCGGPETIITHDFLGKLVNQSVEELFLAMKEVYFNYLKFSPEEITKFVFSNYSEKEVLKKVVDIYKQLI